jgi:hypothetical protein
VEQSCKREIRNKQTRKILTPSVAGDVVSDVVRGSRAVDGQAARLLLKAASQLFLPIVPQLLLLPAAAWLLLPVAVATNNVSVGVQRHFVADLLKTTVLVSGFFQKILRVDRYFVVIAY